MNIEDFPKHLLNGQDVMKTDKASQNSVSSGGERLLLKSEVFLIVGSAMEILNKLGHGWSERPYENALVVEFDLRKIPYVQQPRFDLVYKGVRVGEYVPDLIAFGAVVVETKVIEAISDHERGQILNYLKITGHEVGVILNFKRAKLQWERIVLGANRRGSEGVGLRMNANRIPGSGAEGAEK